MKTLKTLLSDRRGFCCRQNDLMIVVMIIGILAAIAIPKIHQLAAR